MTSGIFRHKNPGGAGLKIKLGFGAEFQIWNGKLLPVGFKFVGGLICFSVLHYCCYILIPVFLIQPVSLI